jgi:hypothetical protein
VLSYPVARKCVLVWDLGTPGAMGDLRQKRCIRVVFKADRS